MIRWARAALVLLVLGGSGCASLSTPVLRHETGEALGAGKFRIRAQLETSRIFPLIPASVLQSATNQETGIFRGGFLAAHAAAGVLSRWDLQLSTFYTVEGGGWRAGTKYQFLQRGPFALAAMLGFGRFAGSGTQTYSTSAGPVDLNQTFSAYNFDFSFPFSWRFTKGFALYSGLNYYRTGVTGSAGDSAVKDSANDFGINLGGKFNWNRFECDLEFAFVGLHNPINDEIRIIPYWGISAGITF